MDVVVGRLVMVSVVVLVGGVLYAGLSPEAGVWLWVRCEGGSCLVSESSSVSGLYSGRGVV